MQNGDENVERSKAPNTDGPKLQTEPATPAKETLKKVKNVTKQKKLKSPKQ